VRWGLLALVVIAGCETRYGAYLVVKGDVEFDHVELYFGAPVESSGTTSQFATPKLGPQTGLVFGRSFDASDVASTAHERETTQYLPPTDANQELGAYVVAVALEGTTPVAIGEYFDFKVPRDAVHEYHLELEPWGQQQVERWGTAPGCIVWKRVRDGHDPVVAVVDADNRDCDDLDKTVDCNDLCSTGSSLCDVSLSLCLAQCALGCNVDGSCTAKLCLPTSVCDSNCLELTDPAARFRCAIERASGRLRIVVDTISGQMCSHMYQFALSLDTNVPCIDPKLVFPDGAAYLGFTYTIAADPTTQGGCVISSTQSNGVAFTTAHTFVASFADPDPAKPRHSVIIGIEPGSDPCLQMGYRIERGGSIYDCTP
jgi:hypothetical protein